MLHAGPRGWAAPGGEACHVTALQQWTKALAPFAFAAVKAGRTAAQGWACHRAGTFQPTPPGSQDGGAGEVGKSEECVSKLQYLVRSGGYKGFPNLVCWTEHCSTFL